MARVTFSSEQQRYTDEVACQLPAADYRQLLAALLQRYPRLQDAGLQNMAIAIDGEIIHEPLLEKIDPDSEIHFFHFIAGG